MEMAATTQARKTLLWVDDNPTLVAHTSRNITEIRPHWNLLLAGSCAEAKKHYYNDNLDLAVLDMGLPDGDGLGIMKELKNIRPQLPVIMVSGDCSEELKSMVYDLGGAAFVEKPFGIRDLVGFIESAVGATRKEFRAAGRRVMALAVREQTRSICVYERGGSLACCTPFDNLATKIYEV